MTIARLGRLKYDNGTVLLGDLVHNFRDGKTMNTKMVQYKPYHSPHHGYREMQNIFTSHNVNDKRFAQYKEKWGIGFCPKDTPIIEGLGLISDNGKSLMANRITFPLINERGDIVSFIGRHHTNKPKYINGKNTDCFMKKCYLYGIHLAVPHILERRYVIICEGQMDTISLHEHGYPNTLGVSGTAFGYFHARKIASMTRFAILAFDSDEAGEIASNRVRNILECFGVDCVRLRLPSEYKDIDEYITQGFIPSELITPIVGGITMQEVEYVTPEYDEVDEVKQLEAMEDPRLQFMEHMTIKELRFVRHLLIKDRIPTWDIDGMIYYKVGDGKGDTKELQALKKKVKIGDVIRKHIGKSLPPNFNHKCPFPHHNDNSPSFKVYEKTNSFHCFGCQSSGSAIDFIKHFYGLSNEDATRRFLDEYGKSSG